MAVIINRNDNFEPGDDQFFDEEGNVLPDSSGFTKAFKVAPGLLDFINTVREQSRKEGYELGQSGGIPEMEAKTSAQTLR